MEEQDTTEGSGLVNHVNHRSYPEIHEIHLNSAVGTEALCFYSRLEPLRNGLYLSTYPAIVLDFLENLS